MNGFDPALALELDRLAPSAAASLDWNDVLTRAGQSRRPARAGVLAAAVAVVGVALLATPAFGIRGQVGELLGIHGRRHAFFQAALTPAAGSGTGTVTAAPTTAFTPVGNKKSVGFAPRGLAVTIRFSGLSGPATAGRIRVSPPRGTSGGGFVIRLCGPCRSGTKVVVHRAGLFLALMSGRATAEITTAAHPHGELRGPLLATGWIPGTPGG